MKPIKQIPSLVSSLQSNKILKKLKENKDSGLFRNESEYNQELKKELIAITNNENKPTFNFIPLTDGVAHSEYINSAMNQILADIEVAFSEINFLFNKITSHQNFYDKTVFEIQTLLSKLERTLEATEIEAGLDTVYNKVHHDSFLNKSNRLSLNHIFSSEAYYDSRIYTKGKAVDLAEINVRAGELTLPKFSEKSVSISSVNIVSTETTVSEFNIQLPGVSTSNLLQDDNSSIWSYNILTKNRLGSPATLVLEVDLGDKKEVNQLFLSPNSSTPCLLSNISYSNENGEEIDLGIEQETLTEDRLYSFPKVIARRFKIRLEQDRNKLIPYDTNSASVSLEDLQRDTDLSANILSISNNVAEQIKDPNIKNILGINQKSKTDILLLNNYSFSLSSIKVGLSDFKNRGIFVSVPHRYKKPSLISLEVKETIRTTKDIITGLDMPAGSIEYSLIKKDYNASGRLLKSSDFPVLPLSTDKVTGERLFFNIDKTLTLRFLAHAFNGDASSVRIFRNGEELVRGVDWVFPERQDPAILDSFMVTTSVSDTKIEILHSNEQILNGVYYAEYIPRYVLESNDSVFDKNVRYLESGATMHPIVNIGEEIAYSDILLRIIIRKHVDAGVSSPIIDFYRLNAKEETDE